MTATVSRQGVQVHWLLYQGLALRDRALWGKAVPVRLDPWDAGTIYVYVHGVWEPCTSTFFTAFQGHSWKEIGLATQELNRLRRHGEEQRRVTARRLAEFLLDLWEREGSYAERVRQQRERDQEQAGVRGAGGEQGSRQASLALVPAARRARQPAEPAGAGRAEPSRQPGRPPPVDRSRLQPLPSYGR